MISWNAVGPKGATGARGRDGRERGDGRDGPHRSEGGDGRERGPTGPKGATGSTGSTGPTGPAGADGNTVLSGTTPPATTIGRVGDYYLDTSTHAIYGPATRTCSPLPCHTIWGAATSLVGPAGKDGQVAVYDTYDGVNQVNDPSGQSERVMTQTLPVGGDFQVDASVVGLQTPTRTRPSGPATSWRRTRAAAP